MVFDFDRAPFLVIWEVTRACALSCVHCRADAIGRREILRNSAAAAARCELRDVCGGSRSRAFAATGDAFAEDPLCAYDPPSLPERSMPFR